MGNTVKNKENIVSIIIVMLTIIANVLKYSDNAMLIIGVLQGIVVGISQSIGLLAYIVLLNRPIVAVAMLMLSEVLLILNDIVEGVKISEAVNSSALTISLFVMAIVMNLLITDNKYRKEKEIKKVSVDTLKKSFSIDRKPFKVKGWIRIIMYSTLVTVVMNMTGSSILGKYGSGTGVKTILALSLVLPIFINIATMLNLIVSYELIWLKTILEGIILLNILDTSSDVVAKVIFYVAELVLIVYCSINLFTGDGNGKEQNKITDNQERDKESKEES